MYKKKDVFKYFLILVAFCFSISIIMLFENPKHHILSFWTMVIIIILVCRIDVIHPYFWFTSSFALYSTAYSITYVLDYHNSGYSKENLLLPLIGLSVVLLILGVQKCSVSSGIQIEKTKNYNSLMAKDNKKITELILMILLVTLFLCTVIVFRTPFNHKNDLLSERNIFFLMGVYVSRYLTFFSCLYMLLFINIDSRKTKLLLLSSSILILLFSLFTGERDVMFRFFLVLVMTLFVTRKINKELIIMLIPIGILLMILSVYFKYYFVNGTIKSSFEGQSYLYNFLSTDFSSAGSNLQILLNNTWTKSMHGFSLIVTDFLSPFFRSGIFFNADSWFNKMFYYGSYSRAFTLVGEGYIIAGTIGVITIFTILGCGIKIMYKMASQNIYWTAVYIYSIPTIISTFRSTLSTASIALVRIVLLSIVVHIFLLRLIRKSVL